MTDRDPISASYGSGPSGVALNFAGADLRNSQLLRTNAEGGDFTSARLDDANLIGARLACATFKGASLVGAELGGADLTGADLSVADLREARVEGACLAGANCRGAQVGQLLGTPASVAGLIVDYRTAIRSGFADEDVIQLWRAGVIVEQLELFSGRVQHACSTQYQPTHWVTGRDVAIAEAESCNARLPRSEPLSRRGHVLEITLPLTRIEALMHRTRTCPESGDEYLGARLVELIDTGPNGQVWKAMSRDGQDIFAIKLFDPRGSSDGARAGAFKRGTDTLNRIAITSGGEAPCAQARAVARNGLSFAYDYFANGNMRRTRALNWGLERTLEFIGRICRGVGQLHELGIVHGALKPTNVLIDDNFEPVLVDAGVIGLAPARYPALPTEQIYIAPEQLLGNGTQSPTADIYSLGRLLWFMLLGHDPDEIVEGLATLTSLQDYPAGLLRIIRRATAYDPAVRYQWIRELERDLARYRFDEEVGIAGNLADLSYRPFCISSLPAPPLHRRRLNQHNSNS